MRNMKIEINEAQPLDEVVGELEYKGYVRCYMTDMQPKTVCAYHDGFICSFSSEISEFNGQLTTLAELKEMK